MNIVISAAVEGPSDEAVLRRLITLVEGQIGNVYGRNGKNHLLKNLNNYNHAARISPWVVLIDMDRDQSCSDALKQKLLPTPASKIRLRLVVRELKSWLLAECERFASFFAVSATVVPQSPDSLPDAQQALIHIVCRSRRKSIREDVVPDLRLGQTVGPAYTSRMIEFIDYKDGWRPESAARNSPSLRRAIVAMQELIR